MNCENPVDIDNFINDIVECSNIKQNGNPECITRLLFIKEDIKIQLKILEGYFRRLLREFKSQKSLNRTNVTNKINKINNGIKTLIDFTGATQPKNTRKERIEEIFYAFSELAKIHKGVGGNKFEKIYHGFPKYHFRKYGKRILFFLITVPIFLWGIIESYEGLYEKTKDLSHVFFTEKISTGTVK